MTIYRARCACGTVRMEAAGEPVLQCYCHCNACRSFSGAPVNAVALWPRAEVRFVAGEIALRRYRPKGRPSCRLSCGTCGGLVGSDIPDAGLFDIFAGLVAGLRFRPTIHINYENSVLCIRDGLPKFKDMPERSGGSGTLMAE